MIGEEKVRSCPCGVRKMFRCPHSQTPCLASAVEYAYTHNIKLFLIDLTEEQFRYIIKKSYKRGSWPSRWTEIANEVVKLVCEYILEREIGESDEICRD